MDKEQNKEQSDDQKYDEKTMKDALLNESDGLKENQEKVEKDESGIVTNLGAVDESKEKEDTSEVTRDEDGTVTNLGKVKTPEQKIAEQNQEAAEAVAEMGYKNMPMESLPSKGVYYPKDTRIEFRSASIDEIKHYSSMDESDLMDVDEKIGAVLGSCVKIKMAGKMGSYQDLKEFDKIYILFAIRDITMLKHHREKKLFHTDDCDKCGKENKIEIENQVFGYFDIEDGIMKWYDENERCFIIKHEKVGEIKAYIPSIGVMKYIADYMKEKEIQKRQGRGGYYNKQYLTFLQFLVADWKNFDKDHKYLNAKMREIAGWTYDKHSAMIDLVERLNVGIKSTILMTCKHCQSQWSSVVFFRRGYRSILDISGIGEELFSA